MTSNGGASRVERAKPRLHRERVTRFGHGRRKSGEYDGARRSTERDRAEQSALGEGLCGGNAGEAQLKSPFVMLTSICCGRGRARKPLCIDQGKQIALLQDAPGWSRRAAPYETLLGTDCASAIKSRPTDGTLLETAPRRNGVEKSSMTGAKSIADRRTASGTGKDLDRQLCIAPQLRSCSRRAAQPRGLPSPACRCRGSQVQHDRLLPYLRQLLPSTCASSHPGPLPAG